MKSTGAKDSKVMGGANATPAKPTGSKKPPKASKPYGGKGKRGKCK